MGKTYKGLLKLGRFFCLFNVNKTGKLIVYRYDGEAYAKTTNYGQNVNGVKNLVHCTPCKFGIIHGYKEI